MSGTDVQVQRLELFGGPMDGDHRTTKAMVLHFASDEPQHVHEYVRSDRGFEWRGLVEEIPTMKVFTLTPGQRS